MNYFLPSVMLLGIAGMASGAQVALEADSWGEPVDGVQLHLALATVLPVLPGELPTLQMRIRNQGSTAIVARPEAFGFAQIEIDGIWYGQDADMLGMNAPVVIAPGAQRDINSTQPYGIFMYELGSNSPRGFALLPGPHRIRVRNLESNSLKVRTAEGKPLQLVSNYIAISVAALTASAEREWRAAQATAAGIQSMFRTNEDPQLSAVQVTSTRMGMRRVIQCVSIDAPGVHRSPERQAGLRTESPELRNALEVVDRYLATDLTRSRSMLRVNFQRIEDRGDEAWFTYELEYPACVLAGAENTVTMVYNKQSGGVTRISP